MSNKTNEKMDGVLDNSSDKPQPAGEKREKPARPPKARKPLGRETKVGLGVIGALLVILVIVLVIRLRGGDEDDLAKQDTNAIEGASDKKQEKSKPSTSSSASMSPKVINATSGNTDVPRYFGSGSGGTQEKPADRSVYGGSLYANNSSARQVRGNSPGYLPPSTPATVAIDHSNEATSAAQTDADNAVENPLRPGESGVGSKSAANPLPQFSMPGSKTDINKLANELTTKDNASSRTPFDSSAADPFSRLGGTGPSFGNDVEASADPSGGKLDERENLHNPGTEVGQIGAEANRLNSATAKSLADDSMDRQSNLKRSDKVQSNDAPHTGIKWADPKITHEAEAKSRAPSLPSVAVPRSSTARASTAQEVGDSRQPLAAADLDEVAPSEKAKPPATLKTGEATASGELYTVQNNDTYWTIAEKTYGSGAYFKALYEHNRRRLEGSDSLRAGVQLVLPEESTLRRLYPALCPRPSKLASAGKATRASATADSNERGYVVREGDTLYEIARRQLGKASRWAEVYELNRDSISDATDRLAPGTRLVLPEDSRNTRREQ